MSVRINESTKQVIVTDPNASTLKVVSVGIRGPKGEETTNVGNIQIGIGTYQNEITVQGTTARDLLLSGNQDFPEANIVISSNFIPSSNEVYSLGTPDRKWKDIYVSDGTIFIGVNSSISGDAINVGNFNVDSDGTIRIPGVDITADANAVDTVQIVASDIASNAQIQLITGLRTDLETTANSNLVAAINELNSIIAGEATDSDANDYATYSTLVSMLNEVQDNVSAIDASAISTVQDNVIALEANVNTVQDNVAVGTANTYNTYVTLAGLIDTVQDNVSVLPDSSANDYATYLSALSNDYVTYSELSNSINLVQSNLSSSTDADANDYNTYTTVAGLIDTVQDNVSALPDSAANDYNTYTTVSGLIDTVQDNVDSVLGDLTITGANLGSSANTITISETNVLIQGNLIVEGNTTQVNSTVTTIQDPIITLGGNTDLTVDDGNDRGIEFRYYEDSQSKLGFFGYDSSANNFKLLLDATNSNEEFTGTTADLVVSDLAATTVTVSDRITTVTIEANTFTANEITANTIVAGVEGDVTGNITGNITSETANITSLEIGSINSLNFPTADGTALQILATDGSGNLYFKDDNAGEGSAAQIGTPTDGNFNDGAYTGFSNTTTISDAVDIINEVVENIRIDTFVKEVDFTSNVTSGNSPLSVQLTLSPTGNVNQYIISWGDGSSNTTTSSTSVDHTYNVLDGGQQSITVTATNTSGSGEGSETSKTRSDYISLATPTPIPSFSLADDTIDSGDSVSLTNNSQYADAYEISWGDGSANASLGSSGAGTPGNGALTHTYTNSSGDEFYTITLTATSSSNGEDVTTTDSVYVYSTHTPSFTSNITSGNNEEASSGLPVRFTNSTSSSPGDNSDYPDSIQYQWIWGDGTSDTVQVGSGASGDTGNTIDHTFALSDTETQQTFEVQLKLFNGHSTSPFASSNTTITVSPDPRSEFVGAFTAVSSGLSSSTSRIGYLMTDYNGNKRYETTFDNQSENTDTYEWDFGDSNTVVLSEGAAGTPTGSNIVHEYLSVGDYDVSLVANGVTSLSATDDTDSKSNYIRILAAPTPPNDLSTKSLTMTADSEGIDPELAYGFDDNTGGSSYSEGDSIPRSTEQIGYIYTDTLSTYAFSSNSGVLSANVNGVADGSKTFTTGDDSGTYTSLIITEDIDANGVNAGGSPVSGASRIYPTDMYRVFKAYIRKSATAITDGVNALTLSHSETGETNTLEFVKESLTATPSFDLTSVTLTENTAGSYRYISGVPYYNTGGIVTLSGVKIYDWIDQTYRNTTTPLTIAAGTNDESTSGDVISSQTKTYSELDGATTYLFSGRPIKGTGVNSSNKYTLGDINVNVNGSARAVETIKMRALNVNGTGSYSEFTDTKIQVYSQSVSGFDETTISISDSLGATYDDDGKRIVISSASGATPAFNGSTNYYTSAAWTGSQTMAGTDEAVVRWGTLSHFDTDLSSGYLPVGPDLATGRSGTQYFRMAFRRSNMSNFVVRITGKISSFNIALPGSGIDDSSDTNGWLDATTQYNGAGQPGADETNGGNGSNGCALTGADVIPTGSIISNQTYTLTFGTENASNATGNQILASIGLSDGDYITSLSFEETS